MYVLGHIHENYLEEKEGWAIIHPDTWRDEYTMDVKTRMLTHKTKRYVHVLVENDKINWKLIECPIKRSSLNFNRVYYNKRRNK